MSHDIYIEIVTLGVLPTHISVKLMVKESPCINMGIFFSLGK